MAYPRCDRKTTEEHAQILCAMMAVTGQPRCGSTSKPTLSSVRSCGSMTNSSLQAAHEIARPSETYLPSHLMRTGSSGFSAQYMKANSHP